MGSHVQLKGDDGPADKARGIVRKLHGVLTRLEEDKRDGSDERFYESAREMQLQLLLLRRVHRAMAKATDAGRASEQECRRVADGDHAHLETRQYESACSRAAARHCRFFPTPQLTKLAPHLPDAGPDTTGMAALEAERTARAALAEKLGKLEEQRAEGRSVLGAKEKLSAELLARLRSAQQALDGVMELQEMGTLPALLQRILTKFDSLPTDEGVTVHVDGLAREREEPPEKRARTSEGESASPESVGPAVVVGLASGASSGLVRFSLDAQQQVQVAGGGAVTEGILSELWDKGYQWAQQLAGDELSATEVLAKIKAKLP